MSGNQKYSLGREVLWCGINTLHAINISSYGPCERDNNLSYYVAYSV